MEENNTKISAVPLWEKYALTICEASRFFGIGEKKLRDLIKNNPDMGIALWIGSKCLIKRRAFEKYLDDSMYL